MPRVVLEMGALIFQRIECLIFDLPPGPSPAPEGLDIGVVHAQIRHPAKMLDGVRPALPVLEEVHAPRGVRGVARHRIEKPKALGDPGGPVVPRLVLHSSGQLGRADLGEQIAVIPLFAPEEIVAAVRLERVEVRGMGTAPIFRNDHR